MGFWKRLKNTIRARAVDSDPGDLDAGKHMPGRFLRRYDSLGRPYYIQRDNGKRVSARKWKKDRDKYKRAPSSTGQEKQKQKTKLEEPKQIQRTVNVPPTGGPGERLFPPEARGVSVGPTGVPAPQRRTWVDEYGVEWDDADVQAVEGETETGEAT